MLLPVLWGGLGGFIGYLITRQPEGTVLGTLAGAAVAMWIWVLRDSWKLLRILRWMRDPDRGAAPKDAGYWGEASYLVEKVVRGYERKIQIEAEQQQEFLRAIDASPNGVLMLDAEDHIRWMNRTAGVHFGLDPSRDLMQKASNLIREPRFVQALSVDQAGTIQWNHARSGVSLSVVIRPYGESRKLVLSQDVSERERHDAARRDFVANASHEIRTPLTVLSGYIETLGSLRLSASEQQQVLTQMGQQSERLLAIVDDLLTLARIEGRPTPSTAHWAPILPLMQRCHDEALALSQGRHHLRLVWPGEAFLLAGHEGEFHSAISNLLSNAIRYTPNGGQISLQAEWNGKGEARVWVEDNGIGIDAEHLPRLTERFYRVDGSRSRDSGGTGLGLSIVKHIMQRHGGHLDIQSEAEKGSKFILVFPSVRVKAVPLDKP